MQKFSIDIESVIKLMSRYNVLFHESGWLKIDYSLTEYEDKPYIAMLVVLNLYPEASCLNFFFQISCKDITGNKLIQIFIVVLFVVHIYMSVRDASWYHAVISYVIQRVMKCWIPPGINYYHVCVRETTKLNPLF